MSDNILKLIEPIIREKPVWDAFISLIEHEEEKLFNLLRCQQDNTELVRINAKVQLLNQLKRYRDAK